MKVLIHNILSLLKMRIPLRNNIMIYELHQVKILHF